nr:hypothetical protein [Flavobacterium haoranii]
MFLIFIYFLAKKKLFLEIKNEVLLSLKKNKNAIIVISFFIISLLFYYIINPRNFDTLLYHVAAIQWNESYRVIPGLANFYDRLGFNSSMFVLSAGFTFKEIYNQHIFIINSLLFTVFSSWLIVKAFRLKNIYSLLLVIYLYFFSEQYIHLISSCGTDTIANILISYILLSLLIIPNAINSKKLVFIIIPFVCITVKFSVLPILIISLYSIFQVEKLKLNFIKTVTLYSIFYLGGWLIRNFILSGYLFYPNPSLDFFSVDWKVPKERVSVTYKWIISFGRIPFKSYPEVLKLSFKEWFPIWWEAALLKNKTFYILSLFSSFLITINLLIVKKRKENFKIGVILITCITGVLLWLFTAPDIRFSFAFILFLSLLPLYFLKSIKINRMFTTIIIVISFCYMFYKNLSHSFILFKHNYNEQKIVEYLYLPNDFSEQKKTKSIKYLDFNLKTPNKRKIKMHSSYGDSYIYDKFPCTTNYLYNIELRGENLQDGFRTKK